MSDDNNPDEVLLHIYGIDTDDLDHVYWMPDEWERADPEERPDEKPDPEPGFNHEAHEAATLAMNVLKERFDWADDITGVAMEVRDE